MIGIKSLFLLIFLWTLCPGASAEGGGKPITSVALEGTRIEINATVTLPLRPCEAYAMLTDYEKLPSFVPGLLESHARRLSGNRVRVRQLGEVHVFVFHLQTTSQLEMEETPNRHIGFRQLDGDMTESYEGAWNFSAAGEGTEVGYRASMVFKSFVPVRLAKSVLQSEVREQFAAIAREAVRRKEQDPPGCVTD